MLSQLSPLFNWLFTQTSSHYSDMLVDICRYQEQQTLDGVYRYRLLLAAEQCNLSLQNSILTLVDLQGIAVIERNQDLLCCELVTSSAISQTQQASLIAQTELFFVNQALPRLSQAGLLVMDMDSTAIQIECIDELAALAGVGAEVAAITETAMQGELDFEQSLRARVAMLKDCDASIIQQVCDNLPLMPGLTSMVAELQQHGWKIALASGGFTPFVNHLKDKLNLDHAYANQLDIEHQQLLGTVSGQVVDAQYKAQVVKELATQYQLPHSQTVAIGDGANDIPMVQAAGLGIAYHAKPKLANAASIHIARLDLRALPYLLVN